MISEDSGRMCISILISNVLDIDFADGNTGIDKLLVDSEKTYIVLIDVVPDNKRVVNIYKDLAKRYDQSPNIFIIPIVCSEYLVIKALQKINYDFGFKYTWLSEVLKAVNNRVTINNCPPKSIGYNGTFNSFEKQCKLLLDNSSIEVRNVQVDRAIATSFYLSDSDTLSVIDKAKLIVRELPCVVMKPGFKLTGYSTISSMRAFTDKCQAEFELWQSTFEKIVLPDKWWEVGNGTI